MSLPRILRLSLLLSGMLSLSVGVPAPSAQAAPQLSSSRFDPKQGTDFIVSLAKDANGAVWFGTEDSGIWRRDITGAWTQFTTKDGLGDDNAYCLTLDRRGRIWAGHLNHGVSVWNGTKWQNYGVLEGPLGERVFAIATSPVEGDVWMATNAGLTRYSGKTDSWKHYTRADGLPSNQLSALSIDSLGNIYVGTQCEGLGIGHMEGDYKKWDIVRRAKDTGPDMFPTTPAGAGLPSNLINDVLIGDDDTIYVATTCGLARSSNFGATWSFLRGADWEAKLKGLYKPLTPEQPRENLNRELLREDYITNLAEDEKGLLWIGYRQKGYEIRRPIPDRIAYVSAPQGDEQFPYVSTLVPLGDGTALIASYGDGLSKSVTVPDYLPTEAEKKEMAQRRDWKQVEAPRGVSPLPRVAQLPTATELETLISEAEAVPAAKTTSPLVVPLADDWTTQGDWLGRYGRYWMLGSAMNSPKNYVWGAGALPVGYNLRISPLEKGNSIRHWVHWLSTSNPRVLEMPPIYADSRLQKGLAKAGELRRQAEVDDNGEAYPLTKEGPHVYASLKIPDGLYTLSFYNHNKDGHSGMNRMRDYRISVRSRPADLPLRNIDDFTVWPEVARSRQRDFWGGVYQKFLVSGPQEITVEYHRNNSFNTILAGIFLDEVNEQPSPYFQAGQDTEGRDVNIVEPQLPESAAVSRLWTALERRNTTIRRGGRPRADVSTHRLCAGINWPPNAPQPLACSAFIVVLARATTA
jgi:streptogramin lyase